MSVLVDEAPSDDVLRRVRAAAESPGARMARARAALARAEERTGARSAVLHPLPGPAEVPVGATAPGGTGPVVGPVAGRSAAAQVPATAASPGHVPDERVLPVVDHLAGLLPAGALVRGGTLEVRGSTSLVLGLVARASQEGSWVAVVGMPQVGVLAAHQTGVALERLALVPDPGRDAATVVAALLDGIDVVVVGPRAVLDDVDRRRLSARARERGAVLLSAAEGSAALWPGSGVVLTAEGSTWEGVGRGEGRLRTRRMTVRRVGRGAAARPVRLQVDVPPPREAVVPWASQASAAPTARTGPVAVAPVPEGRRAG